MYNGLTSADGNIDELVDVFPEESDSCVTSWPHPSLPGYDAVLGPQTVVQPQATTTPTLAEKVHADTADDLQQFFATENEQMTARTQTDMDNFVQYVDRLGEICRENKRKRDEVQDCLVDLKRKYTHDMRENCRRQQQMDAHLLQLNQGWDAQKEEIQGYKHQLCVKDAKITDLEAELGSKTIAYSLKQHEIQGFQDQLRDKDGNIAGLQAELSEKTAACNAKQAEIQGFQDQLRDQNSKIADLQAELSAKTTACNAKQGEIQGFQDQLRDQNSKIAGLQAELARKSALLVEGERRITPMAQQDQDMAMHEFKFFVNDLQTKHKYTPAFGMEFENINANTKIPQCVKALIVQVQEQERALYTQRLRQLQSQAEEVDTDHNHSLFALRDHEESQRTSSAYLDEALESATKLLASVQYAQSKARTIIALQQEKIEDVRRGL